MASCSITGNIVIIAPKQLASLPGTITINCPDPLSKTALLNAAKTSALQVVTGQKPATGSGGQVLQDLSRKIASMESSGSSVGGHPTSTTKAQVATCNINTEAKSVTVSKPVSMITVPKCPTQLSNTSQVKPVKACVPHRSTSPSNITKMAPSVHCSSARENSESSLASQCVTTRINEETSTSTTRIVPSTLFMKSQSVLETCSPSLSKSSLVTCSSGVVSNGTMCSLSTMLTSSSLTNYAQHMNTVVVPSNNLNSQTLPLTLSSSNELLSTQMVTTPQVMHTTCISRLPNTHEGLSLSNTLSQTTNSDLSSSSISHEMVTSTAGVQSTYTDQLPFTSNLDFSTISSSFNYSLMNSLAPTVVTDTSMNLIPTVKDSTMPSPVMSPGSFQSILQSMICQTDAQLLWSTMANSQMTASPIFKLADSSKSAVTVTSSATTSLPKTSPLLQGLVDYTCQQSNNMNIPDMDVLTSDQQITESLPENPFDLFNDQAVSEEGKLEESEIIFSNILSSKPRGTGSGYGLGIDFEELLANAGMGQDAFNL